MAKARNNVARLPFEARKRVCELLFDGASYDAVREALQSLGPGLTTHNSSLLAYQKSAEYLQYCESRKRWEKQTLPNRWAATLLNDGRGIESAADLAAMELLGQIHELSGAGLEVKDAQKLAASVVALKRSASSAREKALKAEFDAKEAAYTEKIASLENRIKELTEQLTGTKEVDSAKVADALDAALGVR